MTDFHTSCASYSRFYMILYVKSFKMFVFYKKTQIFMKISLKIKNDFDFAKKLSHKNAIKRHIFGDADFADF